MFLWRWDETAWTSTWGGGIEQSTSALVGKERPVFPTECSLCCSKPVVSYCIPPRTLSFKQINLLSLKGHQTQLQPGVKPSAVRWLNKEGAALPGFNSLTGRRGEERKKPQFCCWGQSGDVTAFPPWCLNTSLINTSPALQREDPCKGPQPFSSADPLWNFVIAFAVLPLLLVGTAERLRRYEMSVVPGSSGLLPSPLSTPVALWASGEEWWRVLASSACSGCLITGLKHLKNFQIPEWLHR